MLGNEGTNPACIHQIGPDLWPLKMQPGALGLLAMYVRLHLQIYTIMMLQVQVVLNQVPTEACKGSLKCCNNRLA